MKKNWYLYILALEQNKWFVGVSTNPKKRYHQHEIGKGSAWTRKYKPLQMDKVIDLKTHSPYAAQYYEEILTMKLQAKHGKHNVRGGDITDINRSIRWFGLRLNQHMWESILLVIVLSIGVGYLFLDKYKLLPW